MANRLGSFAFIIVMFFAGICLAAPSADFLNTKVYAIIPANGLADGGSTLSEFVASGLKQGVWKKTAENQWTYRVSNVDPVSRKKVDVTLLFIKTTLQEFKGKTVIVLNRVVDGGYEYSPKEVYNFFMQISGSLPSVQRSLKQASDKNNQERRTQELNSKNQAIVGLFSTYKTFNGQSMRLDQLSKDQLKLSMQIVKTQYPVIDERSTRYDQEDTPSAPDNNGTEYVACKIDNKISSYKIGKDDMGWDFFSVMFEEPDCSIKINTTGGFSETLEVKYKGSCSKYCNGSNVEKHGGFSGFYGRERKQEAQPVNDWK